MVGASYVKLIEAIVTTYWFSRSHTYSVAVLS